MIIIILLVIALLIYAFIENRFLLLVRREKFGRGIKIAHISDLHKRSFGRNNIRISKKIEKESPDIIIISGDLISRTENDFSHFRFFLEELCSIAPVYMIFGNHEQSLTPESFGKFTEEVLSTDAILLKNENRTVEIKGRKLNITGLLPNYTIYKKENGYRDLDIIDIKEMHRLVGKRSAGETLLIAHNPLFAESYSEWGADYTLSGHIHGGAVRIPFTSIGILSPERKLFPKYSKGVYTIGKMKLLVSGGLGKLRLFNPPELVIYEI